MMHARAAFAHRAGRLATHVGSSRVRSGARANRMTNNEQRPGKQDVQQMVERVKHWEWTWNNDVMRMVDECYAPECGATDKTA